MPLAKISFRPGVNKETTSYGIDVQDIPGWFDSNLIRFRKGRPEKMGGWEKLSSNTIEGTTGDQVAARHLRREDRRAWPDGPGK